MAATKQDIERWFDQGKASGAKYMVVICDTFDHEDYPAFAADAEDAQAKISSPGSMQRAMECYDLLADKQPQLNADRSWAITA